ncbi:hypothetical protein ACTWP7_19600 [Halobacillus sp. B29]
MRLYAGLAAAALFERGPPAVTVLVVVLVLAVLLFIIYILFVCRLFD